MIKMNTDREYRIRYKDGYYMVQRKTCVKKWSWSKFKYILQEEWSRVARDGYPLSMYMMIEEKDYPLPLFENLEDAIAQIDKFKNRIESIEYIYP